MQYLAWSMNLMLSQDIARYIMDVFMQELERSYLISQAKTLQDPS